MFNNCSVLQMLYLKDTRYVSRILWSKHRFKWFAVDCSTNFRVIVNISEFTFLAISTCYEHLISCPYCGHSFVTLNSVVVVLVSIDLYITVLNFKNSELIALASHAIVIRYSNVAYSFKDFRLSPILLCVN